MARPRSFAAGSFLLELDGRACGFLQRVEGGAIRADVVTQPGQAYFDEKHLGGIRYEELALRLDLALDKTVYEWIGDTWTGKPRRRDVSIVTLDMNRNAVSEREFFQALPTEVTLPALDAAAKDVAFLTVKLVPEYVRAKKGSGVAVKAPTAKQKAFLPSNFKLEIDGLDCSKVNKVGALTVRQTTVRDAVGEARDATKVPSRVEFPNLRISLAQATGQTWSAWFDDFVVKGNNDATNERSGKLSFLAPDRKSTLAEVRFFNLGIFRLEPEAREPDADQIARLEADLYCERMELKVT